MVPMWMYPVAIACGNTFVLKPSGRDPNASSSSPNCGSAAGRCSPSFNGDKEAVDAILDSPT